MKLLCVLVLLCSAAYAQEGPACEAAAGECAAACARDALAVVQFACRETPFGLLRSCACGAAPQMVRWALGAGRAHACALGLCAAATQHLVAPALGGSRARTCRCAAAARRAARVAPA
jgi:hypothetical protein